MIPILASSDQHAAPDQARHFRRRRLRRLAAARPACRRASRAPKRGSTISAIPRAVAVRNAPRRHQALRRHGRLLERASPKMAKPLQPKTEAEVGKLRAKLNYAGFRSEAAPSIFLGLKIICLAARLPRRRRHDALHQRLDDRSRHVHRRHRRHRVLPARSHPLVLQEDRAKTTSSSACPMRST